MAKLKLKGKDLRNIGFPEGPVVSVAMNIMEKAYKHSTLEEALEVLKPVVASPADFLNDAVLGKIAEGLMPKPDRNADIIPLNTNGISYNVFGADFIEEGAVSQMFQASRLPVSVAGALMPDAHSGYGLPIGGVLATDNVVIPYGVGVDIGCRMCLSIFDIDPKELDNREHYFNRELNENTLFGAGREFTKTADHEILYREEFDQLGLLKGLQSKAARQLGSSGSGNHFVEFGVVEIREKDEVLNIEPGSYLAFAFRFSGSGRQHRQPLHQNCKGEAKASARSGKPCMAEP
jgi:tRNA-splicing ligase RtcB (3'-phosphate/5'-hydroxy nucleic acid ligase)